MAATDQTRRLADMAGALRLGRELVGHDRWSAERLEAHQRRRLGELVRHAAAGSRFYRERYAGLDPGDPVELQRLPAVDKATVMAASTSWSATGGSPWPRSRPTWTA